MSRRSLPASMAPMVHDDDVSVANTDPLCVSPDEGLSTMSQWGSREPSPIKPLRILKSLPSSRQDIPSSENLAGLEATYNAERSMDNAELVIDNDQTAQHNLEALVDKDKEKQEKHYSESVVNNDKGNHIVHNSAPVVDNDKSTRNKRHSAPVIYNAERVSPDAGTNSDTEDSSGEDISAILSGFPAVPKRWSLRSSDSDAATSHSRWPTQQLNPIVERSSVASLRTSHSLPRLNVGPERQSRVVHSQSPVHSVHATQAPWSVKSPSPTVHVEQRNSMSLSGEMCMPTADTPKKQQEHSSGSDYAAGPASTHPLYPNMPMQSPPEGVETPPGLPSFGTREATEWRLRQGPFYRTVFRRILPGSEHALDDTDHDEDPATGISLSPNIIPLRVPQQEDSATDSTEALGQTFGVVSVSRLLTPAPEAPRASLLPGLYNLNIPGSLALADDGTYVRGRFGARTSGHGVGARGLEAHPLGRLNEIADQVADIDKACERADLERIDTDAQAQDLCPRLVADAPEVAAVHELPAADVIDPLPALWTATPSLPVILDADIERDLRSAIEQSMPHLRYTVHHSRQRTLYYPQERMTYRPHQTRYPTDSSDSIFQAPRVLESFGPIQDGPARPRPAIIELEIESDVERKTSWWVSATTWIAKWCRSFWPCIWVQPRRQRLHDHDDSIITSEGRSTRFVEPRDMNVD